MHIVLWMESQHSAAKISIPARRCPADLLIAHQIQHVIVKHDRQTDPSFIILKITAPRKTPDTTTVFDDGAVACWKPARRGRAASAASHFKAKGADGLLYSPRLFERVDLRTRRPRPRSRPTERAFKCSTLLTLCRGLGFKVRNVYRLPNSSTEHRHYSGLLEEYWIAALSYLQHTVHTCILNTLRSRQFKI